MIIVDTDRLAGTPRLEQRTLILREGAAVKMGMMDPGVAAPAEQFLRMLGVSEELQGGRVRVGDAATCIDDVHGVSNGIDQLGKGICRGRFQPAAGDRSRRGVSAFIMLRSRPGSKLTHHTPSLPL